MGGEDFWRDIQDAIRERTAKFLFVLSRNSNIKSGPLNELEVATKLARKDKLKDFIIPLWVDDLAPSEFDIRLTSLNAIPFRPSWAAALGSLLRKLEEDGIPKHPSFNPSTVASWWRQHAAAMSVVKAEPETLISNWYPIEPVTLYVHELERVGAGALEVPARLPYPAVPYNQYLLAFAPAAAFEGRLGMYVSITHTTTRVIGGEETDAGFPFLNYKDRRQVLGHLLRQAWLAMVEARATPRYELANNAVAIYFPKDVIPNDAAFFVRADGTRSYRQVVGYRTVGRPDARRVEHWHFALQGKATTSPVIGYTMKPHVLFSDDGRRLWSDDDRMHRARRSQCKNWWNADWRDRIAGVVAWLAAGEAFISLPVGPAETLRVRAVPITIVSPVSYDEPDDADAVRQLEGDEEVMLDDWGEDADAEAETVGQDEET